MASKKNKQTIDLLNVFNKATEISLSLVALPIVFLLIGVFLDKRLHTIPLFIVIGIVSGVAVAVYKLVKLERNLKNG